ncbi:tetratricopeptide repeat protein [Herbidospora sp. NBRC 101105]|uniref:tetratricopeptide repeat protein n=1 Tax=Herbidospora sp. NBRC 101105 TaxID=3032195 RepID=UPI0024A00A9B|nr:tetratricopeptide repeat protein [Herbidospora sp. NBRC 101105]GLX92946.1 hypothetical protein Hesp01_08960 [Herbidospora sp. NBRC 101105]
MEEADRLLADLADTSLITFSEDGATVLMHRLTSRVLRERAGHHTTVDSGDDEKADRLVQVLDSAVGLLHRFNTHIPDGAATWAARPAVEMLVEQTTPLRTLATTLGDPSDLLLSLRSWCGSYLEDLADLARAIPLLEQTLADLERVLGGDYPDTLTSRNDLTHAYQAAGHLGRAIPLHEPTLTDCERVLGAEHPMTRRVRGNVSTARQQVDADPA